MVTAIIEVVAAIMKMVAAIVKVVAAIMKMVSAIIVLKTCYKETVIRFLNNYFFISITFVFSVFFLVLILFF